MKNKFLLICILSVAAFINAGYLSYKAYLFRFVDPLGLSSFCDVSSTFSCTEVLLHPLSQVFGVSFPWVAFVVYPVLFVLAYLGYKKGEKGIVYAKVLMILSFLGMMFNGFFIYREAMYIHSFCILCLICTAIIVTIFGISVTMVRKARQ